MAESLRWCWWGRSSDLALSLRIRFWVHKAASEAFEMYVCQMYLYESLAIWKQTSLYRWRHHRWSPIMGLSIACSRTCCLTEHIRPWTEQVLDLHPHWPLYREPLGMEEGGMLPPARKTQMATNEDFRKLLETPRANRGGDEPDLRKPKKTNESKPRKRPSRPKPETEKPEQDTDGYRSAHAGPINHCPWFY